MSKAFAIKLKGSLEASFSDTGGASAALSRLLSAVSEDDLGKIEYLPDGLRYVRNYPLLFRITGWLQAFDKGEIRFRDSDGKTIAEYSFEYECSRLLLLPVVFFAALIGLPEYSGYVLVAGGAASALIVIGIAVIFYQVRARLKSTFSTT